jgi:RNA polymerase sigma factor (sigma-70 family)
LGEIRAIEDFDFAYTNLYITYAGYWMYQAMQRAIRDSNDLIRRPQHIRTLMSKASQLEARGKTEAEIEAILKITPSLKTMMRQARQCIGIVDRGGFIEDVAINHDNDRAIDRKNLIQFVRDAINSLPERFRVVIERRMRGDSFPAIGEDLGVSKQRIGQIEIKALEQIEDYILTRRACHARVANY